MCVYWQYVSCRAQVYTYAKSLWGAEPKQRDFSLTPQECIVSVSCEVVCHLIMGNPLGLGDELSAAHFAVAVCEKPLVHLCWLHLEKDTNVDMVTDLDALCGRCAPRTQHATLTTEFNTKSLQLGLPNFKISRELSFSNSLRCAMFWCCAESLAFKVKT